MIHGTSTRPQTGSQVNPNIFLRANAAAFAIHSASPPCRYASPPAAIALAEPISAWHPPDAPAMLAFSAITAPIPALTKSASTIRFSVSLQYSSYDKNTAGITPHAPAVGAATIRFIQALDSPIFTAFSITSPMYPPARLRPEALYACRFFSVAARHSTCRDDRAVIFLICLAHRLIHLPHCFKRFFHRHLAFLHICQKNHLPERNLMFVR